MSDTSTPSRPRTTWRASVLLGVGAGLAVALVVLAFVWPVATSAAKDIPIGVVGNATSVREVEAELDQNAHGVFAVTAYADRDAAEAAIRDRTVYGAIVPGGAPELMLASAANTSVATILRGLGQTLQTQITTQLVAAGQDPTSVSLAVTDVVPLSDDDPNGAGLTALSFPVVLGGLAGGIIISLLVAGVGRRLAALALYSTLASLAVVLLTHTWFAILPGTFWELTGGLLLAVLGTASFIVGLHALIGPRGIPIAAILTMLIGNPLSAANMPVQFLASPWGSIGQFFVPGASATLVRDLAYFPDADTTRAWLVLLGWAVAGVALSALGHWRNREVLHLPALEEPLPQEGDPADHGNGISGR